MRGEKRCGIRLSRNPIVAQSAEYPAGGEAHRPLPFCHTVIFSSYIMRITRATRARITFPAADARMRVTLFAFRGIIDNIGVRVAME